jgi:UDP-glucose 4-epimerase
MISYSTGGSGFIGTKLQEKVELTSIPHKDILKAHLLPFETFFFMSSYGNMATHTDHKAIMQANLLDLIHILNEAVQYHFKSFVFISTSSVKLRTQTTYSRSKRAAEEVLLSYLEKFNKPICIVRPYTVTGVGEQQEHLIPTLIRSCMTGELVNFVPNATHDFIDCEDVVNGILNLSDHSARGIYELGSGKSYTNQQVLEIVEKVTGKKANINIVNSMRPYDTDNWVSTNFRSRGFGWSPQKSLEQSIVEMVKAYEHTQKKNT